MKLRTAPSVETIYPVDEDPEAGSKEAVVDLVLVVAVAGLSVHPWH